MVARSFKGGNECHGWMGIKFQSRPRDEPSQILIHVRMLDTEASLQQEALGVVGVNFDMLQCALEKFKADPAVEGKPVLPIFELTMRNLLNGGDEIDRRSFVDLDNFKPEYLEIFSRDVLKKIAAGDEAWKEMVPAGVTDLVVKRRFFGCKGAPHMLGN